MKVRAYCPSHTRYTVGCTGCKQARSAYIANSGGDGGRRYNQAKRAALKRLAAAHPEEFRRYMTEELDVRTLRVSSAGVPTGSEVAS